MSRSVFGLCVSVAVLAGALCVPATLRAEIKPEHRKQVMDIKKELMKVQTLLAKKEMDEAEKILADSETKLKAIVTEAGIMESDKLVAGVFKLIEQKRAGIAKKTGAAVGGVAFEKDVAPILVKNCARCHGSDNPRANLDMTNFAGLVKGGDSGPVVVPGNAAGSEIVKRISATGRGRMPPAGNNNAPGLKPDEIKAITAWVQQGAKFSGDNNTALRDLAGTAPGETPKPMTIDIPKPTGNETVSFSKDIAPWFVRLCGNCHGQNNPRSGFSVATFESIMKGGNSGRVLLPGNRKDSRLWHLVGEQDPLKMPPGQALITERNWEDLKNWIDEGCKFDGSDAKAPIASLVTTAADQRAKELAARSPEEWKKARLEATEGLWKAASKAEYKKVETEQFIVLGDVPEARLKQVAGWADEQAKTLTRMFSIKDSPVWKGRLGVLVFKERIGLSEFMQTHEMRDVAKGELAYNVVNPTQERAFVAVEDTGDTPADETPNLRTLVIENVTTAALKRSGRALPSWVGRGLGLVLAQRVDPKNAWFKGLPATAADEIALLENPGALFQDASFAPADHAAISYSIAAFMYGAGEPQFVKFTQDMMNGAAFETALKNTYGTDSQGLFNAVRSSVSGSKAPAKGKKK